MPESLYDILDIPHSADLEAIKRAYRKQIVQYHPDRFAAELARARADGDAARLQQLETLIATAARQTQRINEAYSILSDAQQRADYDRRQTAYAAHHETPHGQRPPSARSYERATIYTNPGAPHTPTPMEQPLPWGIMAILIAILLVLFGGVTSIIAPDRDTAVSSRNTATPKVPVGSMDATATARAFVPTPRPRSLDDTLVAAAAFYDLGRFDLAADLYTQALGQFGGSATLYYRRGLAYLAQAPHIDDALNRQALADLDTALAIDPDYIDAYAARGLLHYARWLQTSAQPDADAATRDLQAYIARGGNDATARAALADITSD